MSRLLYQSSYGDKIKYDIPDMNVNTFNSNELGRTRTYNSVFFSGTRSTWLVCFPFASNSFVLVSDEQSLYRLVYSEPHCNQK